MRRSRCHKTRGFLCGVHKTRGIFVGGGHKTQGVLCGLGQCRRLEYGLPHHGRLETEEEDQQGRKDRRARPLLSGVSVELIDELRETLNGIKVTPEAHTQIAELTNTLRDNLNKVVQHGKRADAIVKNMLLHSREGSGEHRLVDANSLVEESLNLAYHGARAEKQGFKINIERSLDPAAGKVDVFPQEITRALLNLVSNGFYAATKRKEQNDSEDLSSPLLRLPRRTSETTLGSDSRQRHWHFARGQGEDIQSLLHDQTSRRGHRSWPVDQSRHHRKTTFGVYRGFR